MPERGGTVFGLWLGKVDVPEVEVMTFCVKLSFLLSYGIDVWQIQATSMLSRHRGSRPDVN
jgi:hypothetical protein